MTALVKRRPVFLVFLMIISLNLGGCSAGDLNLSGLFENIAQVATNIGPKIGEWISKGLDFAQNAVNKAREFVEPIIERGREIAEGIGNAIDQVQQATGQVNDGLNQIANPGNTNPGGTAATNDVPQPATDAMGQEVGNAPTDERVTDPSSEFVEAASDDNQQGQGQADTGSANAPDQTEAAAETAQQIEESAIEVDQTIANTEMPEETRDSLKQRLATIIKKIRDIRRNIFRTPFAATRAALRQLRKEYAEVLGQLRAAREQTQGTVEAVNEVVNNVAGSVENTNEAVKDRLAQLADDYESAIAAREKEVKEYKEKLTEARKEAKKVIAESLEQRKAAMDAIKEAWAEIRSTMSELKKNHDEQIRSLETLLNSQTLDKAKEIDNLKKQIEKAKKDSAKIVKKLNRMLKMPMLPRKVKDEIRIRIAEEELRASRQITQLEEALSSARQSYEGVSREEQKKKIEELKTKLQVEFKEQMSKLQEKMKKKVAEYGVAKAAFDRAKLEASERIKKIDEEYKNKIAEKDKQLEELKNRLEQERDKALAEAKRIEELLNRGN